MKLFFQYGDIVAFKHIDLTTKSNYNKIPVETQILLAVQPHSDTFFCPYFTLVLFLRLYIKGGLW